MLLELLYPLQKLFRVEFSVHYFVHQSNRMAVNGLLSVEPLVFLARTAPARFVTADLSGSGRAGGDRGGSDRRGQALLGRAVAP